MFIDTCLLGVVLFRMLTGKLPFDTPDDALLVAQQIFQEPPRPSSIRAGIDPQVEEVILTMLRKHPDNRYASMEALIEDIDRLLGQRPLVLEASRTPPTNIT